ncbi:MAG TPA: glycine zipper family protein [Candidatus Acidoferrales bacterium]|nr:glycine zipper family protein [Candidatus Acidoferrales bacterium]
MQRYLLLVAFLALLGAGELSSMFGVYVYPAKGQSATQQADDESVCYKSAKSKTGVDPANLPPATPAPVTAHQGGALRGAAGGAAGGAAIGAIAGNAGQGAAIGAVTGALVGRGRQNAVNNAEKQYAQANAQAQRSQSMNDFRRAFAACLEAKGYTVK